MSDDRAQNPVNSADLGEAGMSPGVAITYAMNEIMDRGVGRIAETLEELELADDTVLMFTSDNGPLFGLRPDQVPEGMSTDTQRYNCSFNGQKGSVYEGGIRVPMTLRWRGGLEGGRRIDDRRATLPGCARAASAAAGCGF